MVTLNSDFQKITKQYLFPLIDEKKAELLGREPDAQLINMGIGDISLPLAPSVVQGLENAAREMGERPFGYGPAEGYAFLRERIVEVEYGAYGIGAEEVFVSEGINSDLCAIEELFDRDQHVAVLDPTYPVYGDISVMAGRHNITKIPCIEEHGFLPQVPKGEKFDLIYLCSPNNPTGVAMTYDNLREWVEFARVNQSVIFFDAAYAGFITSKDVPKSIYEIEGAEEVAIEFRSFSKSAGFTGLRLGYCVVPKKISKSLYDIWVLRQNTKTNGTSYPVQRAGLSALSEQGQKECAEQVRSYQRQGEVIKKSLEELGFTCLGGKDSPYIWWKIPSGNSWDFFDKLLNELKIVAIPGVGFGECGEGFIRLSSFVTEATVEKFKEVICKLK